MQISYEFKNNRNLLSSFLDDVDEKDASSCMSSYSIFSRQTSLARQAFLLIPLHGARYKTGKTLTAKSSAM